MNPAECIKRIGFSIKVSAVTIHYRTFVIKNNMAYESLGTSGDVLIEFRIIRTGLNLSGHLCRQRKHGHKGKNQGDE
jgi:hypothetical protein